MGDRENGTAYGRKNVTRTDDDRQTDTGRTLKLETACTIAPLRGAIKETGKFLIRAKKKVKI